MTKRIVGAVLSLIMLFGVLGLTGCSDGKTIEVDGWTLFRDRKSKQVTILSADSELLVVDGVLNIPSKIGKYNIYGFGRFKPLIYGEVESYFTITGDVEVEHIILAAELHVDNYFWRNFTRSDQFRESLQYLEFLSDTFERVKYLSQVELLP